MPTTDPVVDVAFLLAGASDTARRHFVTAAACTVRMRSAAVVQGSCSAAAYRRLGACSQSGQELECG